MEPDVIKFLNQFGWFTPEMNSNYDFLRYIQASDKTNWDIYLESKAALAISDPSKRPRRNALGLSTSSSLSSLSSIQEAPKKFLPELGWFYGSDPTKILVPSYESLVRRIEKGSAVILNCLKHYSDKFLTGYFQLDWSDDLRTQGEKILGEFTPVQGICYGLIDLYNIQYLQKEDIRYLSGIHGWTPYCTIDPTELDQHIINYLSQNQLCMEDDLLQMIIFILWKQNILIQQIWLHYSYLRIHPVLKQIFLPELYFQDWIPSNPIKVGQDSRESGDPPENYVSYSRLLKNSDVLDDSTVETPQEDSSTSDTDDDNSNESSESDGPTNSSRVKSLPQGSTQSSISRGNSGNLTIGVNQNNRSTNKLTNRFRSLASSRLFRPPNVV